MTYYQSDPAVCSGQPVFRGTRVLVSQVVGLFWKGVSYDQVRVDYPSLSQSALDYTESLANELAVLHGPDSERARELLRDKINYYIQING